MPIRPVLDERRLNTCELLATAADCFTGSVDAEPLLRCIDGHSTGRVSRITDGMSHADGCGNVEEIDVDSKEWYVMGHDTRTEWGDVFAEKLE